MTIKSVAARAGVSPGTVSHVLNHPDRSSCATRATTPVSRIFTSTASNTCVRAGCSWPPHGRATLASSVCAHGVQVVLIDQVRSGSTDWCAVTVNDVPGGQLATEHLLSRSRARLAYAGGSLDIPQVADRIAGARLSLTTSGRSQESSTSSRPSV